MERIFGQDRAVGILNKAIESGRFHHAWVFAGPKGVGKFTTALEVSKWLLDPTSPPDPNGEVSQIVDSGTHPDLHVIRKELALFSDNPTLRNRKQMTIPIDLLRERMIGGITSDDKYHEAAAYRTPLRGHGKVFIIDEAELLAPVAQDALLKTLEEPPKQTYLFLITSRPERLRVTIRSRCQMLPFQRLDENSMQSWFKQANVAADARTLEWVMGFADGSPGVAQLSLEYGFHDWQLQLDPMLRKLETGSFPVEMGDTLAALVDNFAKAWVKNHKNASKDAANKDGTRHVLSLLTTFARTQLAQRSSQGEDVSVWLNAIECIRYAERQIEGNVNMKLALENLVVQWAQGGELVYAS